MTSWHFLDEQSITTLLGMKMTWSTKGQILKFKNSVLRQLSNIKNLLMQDLSNMLIIKLIVVLLSYITLMWIITSYYMISAFYTWAMFTYFDSTLVLYLTYIFLCMWVLTYKFMVMSVWSFLLVKTTLIFLANIIIFLLLTFIVATITLIERKLLALVQRRVGPNYIGYSGSLQFIADALKLLLKHMFIFSFTNRLLFMSIPALVLIICYLFWMNLVWGPNLAICEIEYNLLLMGMLSMIFSILLFLVGWVSKNKYAMLSSNRMVIMSLNLEIFLNFLFLFLLVLFESFSFYQIVAMQSFLLWGIFLLLPLFPLIIMVFLLETGRMPFDLGEAESELIAGYTTEMGGFFFALFYLGEYFHLFCFSVVYVLCFFGGWLVF